MGILLRERDSGVRAAPPADRMPRGDVKGRAPEHPISPTLASVDG
jgi:hypothetical protein